MRACNNTTIQLLKQIILYNCGHPEVFECEGVGHLKFLDYLWTLYSFDKTTKMCILCTTKVCVIYLLLPLYFSLTLLYSVKVIRSVIPINEFNIIGESK